MKTYFDHEKLDVYKAAIQFVGWVDELLFPCLSGSSEALHRAGSMKNKENTGRRFRRIEEVDPRTSPTKSITITSTITIRIIIGTPGLPIHLLIIKYLHRRFQIARKSGKNSPPFQGGDRTNRRSGDWFRGGFRRLWSTAQAAS